MGQLSKELETLFSEKSGLPIKVDVVLRGAHFMKFKVRSENMDKSGMVKVRSLIEQTSSMLEIVSKKFLHTATSTTINELLTQDKNSSLKFSSKEERVSQTVSDIASILESMREFRLAIE